MPSTATAEEKKSRLAARGARVAVVEERVAARLQARGHRVGYRDPYVPVIAATGDAAAIHAMEADPDVEAIFLQRVYELQLNNSTVEVQAPLVHGRDSWQRRARRKSWRKTNSTCMWILPKDRIFCGPRRLSW